MVNSILDGRKTQTRRVVRMNFSKFIGDDLRDYELSRIFKMPTIEQMNANEVDESKFNGWKNYVFEKDPCGKDKKIASTGCPFGEIGDKLIVSKKLKEAPNPIYLIPRLTLEITDIKVERLQDISDDDCDKEGIYQVDVTPVIQAYECGEKFIDDTERECFKQLWQSIKGKDSWDQNPFVWVISFRRVEDEI